MLTKWIATVLAGWIAAGTSAINSRFTELIIATAFLFVGENLVGFVNFFEFFFSFFIVWIAVRVVFKG